MKNYLKREFFIIAFLLFFILSSNFITAYRGVLFDMFGNMRKLYDLICGIIFGILGLVFVFLYIFLPPVKFLGVKRSVIYEKDNREELKKKFELIDKIEKDFKKEIYISSYFSMNEILVFIETRDISVDILNELNNEIALFSDKAKKINRKRNILYFVILTENSTQYGNAIVSKVVGYRRGGANSLVMPIIIDISEKYLEVCPLEYKYVQDYFLYNQMEHKFVKYLDSVGLISLVEDNENSK